MCKTTTNIDPEEFKKKLERLPTLMRIGRIDLILVSKKTLQMLKDMMPEGNKYPDDWKHTLYGLPVYVKSDEDKWHDALECVGMTFEEYEKYLKMVEICKKYNLGSNI